MLNTKEIYKQIINSIKMEKQRNFAAMSTAPKPTTSKRSMEEIEEPTSPSIVKKSRPTIGEEGSMFMPRSVIQHFIIDKADWDLKHEQILSLFKRVRIACTDVSKDKNGNDVPHYHILGEAKISQRKMRDWSLNNLRAAEIRGGLEVKAFFITARIKNIENASHFRNTVNYIKKKDATFFEDESVIYGLTNNPVWRIIDEAEEPSKHSNEDMDEFRRRFPLKNQWKKMAAQKKLSKYGVDQLMSMEAQRKFEDDKRALTDEEKHHLLPNLPILSHAQNLRTQLVNHDQNSGVCLILCGGALMCKSTINRIIAESFGEYAIWPGSQWIARDTLKFDSAARQGISTIVVEEMQWIDIQHRITLEKTVNSIKEQLTGAGLDVRLAKTKSNLQDDLKLKIDYLLISMNETEYVNYRILSQLINSKAEFRRRFLVINMDDPKYSDISVCRNRPDNNWKGNEVRKLSLSGLSGMTNLFFL